MKLSTALSVLSLAASNNCWSLAQGQRNHLRGLTSDVEVEPAIDGEPTTFGPTSITTDDGVDEPSLEPVSYDTVSLDEKAETEAMMSLANALPYHTTCDLGSGYLFGGKDKAPCAFDAWDFGAFPSCDDNPSVPCIQYEDTKGRFSRSYFDSSSATATTSSMMKIAASVEGKMAGFKASASAEYIKGSDTSTNSVSFYIGQGIKEYSNRLNNHRETRMNENVFNMLKNNPNDFVHRYGRDFVCAVNYGSSYMGSVIMWSSTSTESEDLDVLAQAQYDGGLFSVKGSAEFEQKLKQTNGEVTISIQGMEKGSIKTDPIKFSSPLELYNHYEDWYNGTSVQTAGGISLNLCPYTSLKEVGHYLASLTTEERKKYDILQPVTVGSGTESLLVDEKVTLESLEKTIKRAEEYNHCSDSFEGILSDFKRTVATATDNVEKLDQMGIEQVALQVQSGNYTFFKAEQMSRDLNTIIGEECRNLTIYQGVPTDLTYTFTGVVDNHGKTKDGRWVVKANIVTQKAYETAPGWKTPELIMRTDNFGCEVEIAGVSRWTSFGSGLFFQPKQKAGESEAAALNRIRNCLQPGTKATTFFVKNW